MTSGADCSPFDWALGAYTRVLLLAPLATVMVPIGCAGEPETATAPKARRTSRDAGSERPPGKPRGRKPSMTADASTNVAGPTEPGMEFEGETDPDAAQVDEPRSPRDAGRAPLPPQSPEAGSDVAPDRPDRDGSVPREPLEGDAGLDVVDSDVVVDASMRPDAAILDAAIAVDTGVADAASPRGDGEAESHELADYVLMGAPRALDDISDNLSDVAWRPETDTFFVIENGAARLHEYSSNFSVRLRSVELLGPSTDTEGLSYLGEARFAVAVEENEVYVFSLDDREGTVDLESSAVQRYRVTELPLVYNRGFEGITFAPELGRFFVCQEGLSGEEPMRVLEFDVREDGEFFDFEEDLEVEEPFDAEDRLGGSVLDLSGLHYDRGARNLLVLSDESGALMRVDPETGDIIEERAFSTSPQYEGVTLADRDRLVLVSEPNFVEIYRAPR